MTPLLKILKALPDVEIVPYGTPMFLTARGLVPLPLLRPDDLNTVSGMTPYGGATIGGARDASGEEYTSFDARTHSDNDFRFHVVGEKNDVIQKRDSDAETAGERDRR